ncbi:methyltransferase domain-containing protein [Neptunomonas sp. CHC150]|uniref:putative RNA methyltransferase n=1 Tax=Neptunomonas sp. CHC150 TaxID=2998324 RepID=UPI0025B1536C|nr:methyltransferase domain-containing protein [Neptunomonas sp. CHC150]MDN2658411.1 methyltransferase domain-containing protein [Neptunomonas sp. CHC150]
MPTQATHAPVSTPAFICPVCQLGLILTDNTLRCEQGHSFDRAKQGYWNLLLVQRKRSKDPGDNPDMVRARTAFLDQGFYQPLADHMCKLASEYTAKTPKGSVLDLGCGEGFYTAQLAQALPNTHVYGLDISKHAIRAATKRSKPLNNIHWLVATGAQIPLAAHSQDLLIVMFSRLMPVHFAHILKQTGKLILVWPAANHLIELRQQIYQDIRPSTFDPVNELKTHFTLEKVEQLSFTFTLDNRETLDALIGMTPHSQRINDDSRERLLKAGPITFTFDVHIGTFMPRTE